MPDVKRRALLASLSAAIALPARRLQATEMLAFGLTPVFLTSDRRLLALIREHLERQLGAEVQLVQKRTYQEITTLLLAGQIDAAWICGYPFVAHRDRLELVAVPVWRGRPLYRSYLIVGAGRTATDLSDLQGDIHAFSDPDSNSGYLVTRSRLAAMDTTPDAFFGRSFFTYGHRNVVRAVASGLAQSGSVDGYVWEALTEAEPALPARTRVVWKSEWLGFPPVACRKENANSDLMRRLADALLTMKDSETGRAALALLQLDGFQRAEAALFDGIASRMRSVTERT